MGTHVSFFGSIILSHVYATSAKSNEFDELIINILKIL